MVRNLAVGELSLLSVEIGWRWRFCVRLVMQLTSTGSMVTLMPCVGRIMHEWPGVRTLHSPTRTSLPGTLKVS